MTEDQSWWEPLRLQWSYSLRRAVTMLKDTSSDRKLRLLGIAFCRNLRDLLQDERMLQAVAVAEQLVEGMVDENRVIASRRVLGGIVGRDRKGRPSITNDQLLDCERAVSGLLIRRMRNGIDQTLEATFKLLRSRNEGCPEHVEVLHDIFGNPFRPVSFDSDWRTSTAVALSKQMYDSRDFSAMPILADALQDAGCDNEDILDHCRASDGVHVRGCWVVDLALGKA